jgi:hypothetical protein
MAAPNMDRASLVLAGKGMLVLAHWWPVNSECACGTPGFPSPWNHRLGEFLAARRRISVVKMLDGTLTAALWLRPRRTAGRP